MFKKLVLLTTLFLSLGFALLAQAPPPPPGNPETGGGGGGPVGAPIDGGLGILLAMGAVYAGKKYADSRRKAKADLKNEEQAAQE